MMRSGENDARAYRIEVDGDRTEISESALMSAWSKSIPDLALRIRALNVGESAKIFDDPSVTVNRLS